ncbi:hypothetical protein P3342_002270 [Pyrenophora teres f. teres]|uniref:Uncharacterized protein n=1 Tax=Pyrenophora teres f. teres TaxID=97479 RepID=A0A6S6W478_9PLEO|nr:hypothetical protein P3342_002270 [Pyrenophora teres f. teres]CAE7179134.1 hypothetical protein PTTW11_06490 [Pyrenophora teres f. teres]
MKAFLPLVIAPLLRLALANNPAWCVKASASWGDSECPGWKLKACCQVYSHGLFDDKWRNVSQLRDNQNNYIPCSSTNSKTSTDGFLACAD